MDHAKRLKDLQQENVERKRRVADLSLDKLVLKDILPRELRSRSNHAVRSARHSSSMGQRSGGRAN